MKNFDQIDSKFFEAFWVTSQTLNFTRAAEITFKTQSAVSQQIKKLEEQLSTQLFVRTKKNIYLTPSGKKLRSFIENYLNNLENFQEEIKSLTSSLQGKVRYAMPSSCLISPHFHDFLEFRKKNLPKLQLDIKICTSKNVYEKVLNYEIDFGFVTEKQDDPAIHFASFCEEKYVWIKTHNVDQNISMHNILQQEIIAYPGMEAIYQKWCEKKLKRKYPLTSLNIVGNINDLNGAMDMVRSGMGISIVPEHCLVGQIKTLLPIPLGRRVSNIIYLITLKNLQLSRRVNKVIEVFLAMH